MSYDQSGLNIQSACWQDFSGLVRLFPLPNLVLFPGVMQPLHIFEPRYRQLVRDALDNDGLIAVVLYHAAEESVLSVSAPIHSTACIGKIMAHVELEDGRFNLLLGGLQRVKLVGEVSSGAAYRVAAAEAFSEPFVSGEQTTKLRAELMIRIAARPEWVAIEDMFGEHGSPQDLPLGTLVDLFAFALNLPCEQQQTLLETADAAARCRLLLKFLEHYQGSGQDSGQGSGHTEDEGVTSPFPPKFSYN